MSLKEYYTGYKWIKVPKHEENPEDSCEEKLEKLKKHHIEETTFLIDEIRKLAETLDENDLE